MDRLQAMKVFARVVDEGGFAAAARAMDMSPPVVTRMVADLEGHLGTRLLQRTTRKVALTDAGQAYLERVRAILFDLDDAEAQAAASAHELRGSLHILAPPVLATYFLGPRVAPWRARYPRLLLDITTDNNVASHVDEFDVTFMVVPEDFDGNIVARALFKGEAIVVASPAYLQRAGVPQQPGDLTQHQYLRDSGVAARTQSGRKLRLQHLHGELAAQEVDMPHVALQSVSTELLLRAALDGVGVAVMARLLVEPFLVSGALVQVLPDWMYLRYTVYAALPTRRMVPARTKAFLDFVTEQVPEALAQQRAAAGLVT
jgi:DNA-binding transcriptional LysR family regulator